MKSSNNTKRLRFSETSMLVLTEPKTREEVKAVWYTKREVSNFKRNVRLASEALRDTRTAKAIQLIAYSAAAGLPEADINIQNKEVIHGLERLISPEVLRYSIEKRMLHVSKVLEAQLRQRRAGYVDPSATARVSAQNSSFHKELASRITNFQYA